MNKFYNKDNLKIINSIPDKSIQIFFEDMPYGITACEWDKKINLELYWKSRLPKLKENGCFILFNTEPFGSHLRMSNLKMYKYDWIWVKNRGSNFSMMKYMPMREHENISIFANSILYNPIKINRTKTGLDRSKSIFTFDNKNVRGDNVYGKLKNKKIVKYLSEKRYPSTVLKYNMEVGIHPTQKPVLLIEYLIRIYSNEKDLIFDGYAGSGTTAIACIKTNRNYICCEMNENYYEQAVNRIEKFKKSREGMIFK